MSIHSFNDIDDGLKKKNDMTTNSCQFTEIRILGKKKIYKPRKLVRGGNAVLPILECI